MSLEGSLSGCRSSPLNEQSDGSDPRPSWTERLIDCTKVGDSYRGHVRREEDVEAVVLAHGSQTGTFWSTRQTPSSVANEQQQSTRLMWKSQHVPYDGMPFVNVGKRAVVMECCQGRHRRKQVQKEAASVRQRIDDGEDDGDDGDGRVPVAKRQRRMAGESARVFSVSCPAQICVKKVKKFTQFRVEEEGTARSGKAVRYAKEKCLKSLREVGIENLKGEIRWYMQLPTAQAHEFHVNIDALAAAGLEECIDHLYASQQMDPRLRRKVRELVKVGTTDLADVKDALYSYLENELFANEERPDPGDPCYYPADAELQMEIDLLKNESVNSLMISQRLNPSVLTRLRLLVLQGITNVLEVKHLLKNFVEKELFSKGDTIPDTHDRSFYPTITDLQNHVHVTKEAIANGNPVTLPIPAGRNLLEGLCMVPVEPEQPMQDQDQDIGSWSGIIQVPEASSSPKTALSSTSPIDLIEHRSSSLCEYQLSPPASVSNQTLAATVTPGNVTLDSFDDEDTQITVAEDPECPFSGRGIGLTALPQSYSVQSYESMHMVHAPVEGSGLEVQGFYSSVDAFSQAPSAHSNILESDSQEAGSGYNFV